MSVTASTSPKTFDDAAASTLDVAWIGPRPAWFELESVGDELTHIRFQETVAGADVVHVVGSVPRLRRLDVPHGTPLVLDLSDDDAVLDRRTIRLARTAEAVLVGSRLHLRALWQKDAALGQKAVLFRSPLDLDAHAPIQQLHGTRDAEIKRFRRIHRLVGQTVLFAGPYTPGGGLELALEAVYRLRERHPELRLAAVPHGRIDERHRDACERRALALGHHGIIEWQVAPRDLPLWYGLATVVAMPASEPVSGRPVDLAAAAGRPCVVSELDGLAELVEDGRTGLLVPPGDLETLIAALEAMIEDTDEAQRLGAAARSAAESQLAPAATARQLSRLWSTADPATLGGRRGSEAIA